MKKKALISASLAAGLLLGVAAYPAVEQIEVSQGITASAATGTTTDGWKFSYDETHCEITGCTNAVRGEVTIPSAITIDGKDLPVTVLNNSFYYSGSSRDFITSLTIPASITTIESAVCWGMKNLEAVDIQAQIMILPNAIFRDCTNLETAKLPDGIIEIGDYAFNSCTRLKSIKIPSSVKTLGTNVFCQCESLEKVTIPAKITDIPGYTFSGCTGLKSLTIEDGVKSVGNEAFYGCTSLNNVVLPKSVTKMAAWAFRSCSSMDNLTIENPECSVGALEGTEKQPLTIYGYDDSTAQKYVESYGKSNHLVFKSIGEKPAPEPVKDYGMFCDANGDGTVDIIDVQLVLKYYVEDFAGNKPSWYEITGNPKAPDAP